MIQRQIFRGDIGGHYEACSIQHRIYAEAITSLSKDRERPLNILDFGCGVRGSGRVLIAGIISGTAHRLSLLDPFASIKKPRNQRTTIKSTTEVFEGTERFDLINLSYVLCCIDPKAVTEILRTLKIQNPTAAFTIIDYILKGRARNEVLRLLDSAWEKKCFNRQSDGDFVEQHMRFDESLLINLVQDAGISMSAKSTFPLDGQNLRYAIVGGMDANALEIAV